MNIRSLNELNGFLDEEIAWRKREITTARFLVESGRRHEKDIMLRAGICILYAHWEGFVKYASTAYLNYVSKMGCKYDELQPNLIAISMRPNFKTAEFTSKIIIHNRIAEFYIYGLHKNAEIPWQDVIETRDNLRSEVLEEILCVVGGDYSKYATKKGIIDEKLCDCRNTIAHGKRINIDESDYNLVHDTVLLLLIQFRNDIENSAVNKSYLRA